VRGRSDHEECDEESNRRPTAHPDRFALGAKLPPLPDPAGFDFAQRDNGAVIITHRGKHASTLRGTRATEFLDEVATGDPQLVMARWTGNYKRGNERTAKDHPRNRGRR
jgi:hypothetical protein